MPAELMFGCKLKSQLDQMHPDLNRKVQAKQIRKKECHDRGTKLREFKIGDNVYLEEFSQGRAMSTWNDMSSKWSGIIRSYVD